MPLLEFIAGKGLSWGFKVLKSPTFWKALAVFAVACLIYFAVQSYQAIAEENGRLKGQISEEVEEHTRTKDSLALMELENTNLNTILAEWDRENSILRAEREDLLNDIERLERENEDVKKWSIVPMPVPLLNILRTEDGEAGD